MDADKSQLSQHVYNIVAFNPSSGEFADKVKEYFPHAKIGTSIDSKRQGMVDSWPSDTNDKAAQLDWNWKPQHDLETGLMEYLVSGKKKLY